MGKLFPYISFFLVFENNAHSLQTVYKNFFWEGGREPIKCYKIKITHFAITQLHVIALTNLPFIYYHSFTRNEQSILICRGRQ